MIMMEDNYCKEMKVVTEETARVKVVTGETARVKVVTGETARVKVVTGETARVLLHVESQEKTDLNIKATVRCLSEIFRIKQTQIFLIQLLPGLNIVVKRKDFLNWHEKLCPQRCYIFTHLKSTTLKKGCKDHHHVYTVTKNSKLFCDDDQKKLDIQVVSAEEWLQHCGIGEISMQLPYDDPQPDPDCKLVSYQGVVSKVLDEALGVYELDNRVRLYVSVVPAVHKYGFIQVGQSITLYNVHSKVSKEAPRIRLYCCMLSVLKIDTKKTGSSLRFQFPSAELQKLLYLWGVTIPQLDWLYSIREKLCQYFQAITRKRDIERIFSTLLSCRKLSYIQEPKEHRNCLDEYLSRIHTCCLTAENECTNQTFQTYRTVSQLKYEIETGESYTTSPNEYWQYQLKTYTDQVLIGILETCSVTGRAKLYDASGHINVVIGGWHGDDKHPVCCHGDRCCDARQPGDNFACSYLHSCCIGKIVAIYRYSIATETFITKGNQPSITTVEKTQNVIYVNFSLSDAVILGDTDTLARKRLAMSRNDVKNRGDSSELHTVSSKEIKHASYQDKSENKLPVTKDKMDTENSNLISSSAATYYCHKLRERPVCAKDCATSNKGEIIENQTVMAKSECDIKESESTLHRHISKERGSYFCRKETCLKQTVEEQSPSVMRVKPLFQSKRKSSSNDETKCKVLCVSREKVGGKVEAKRSHIRGCDGIQNSSAQKENRTGLEYKSVDTADTYSNKDVHLTSSDIQNGTTKFRKLKDSITNNCGGNTCLVRVNNRESLIFETFVNDSISSMFSIQGQIWKNDKLETEIVIIFKDKAVRWYQLLWPGRWYQFSLEEEFTPLFRGGLSDCKLLKVVERSNAKKCVVAHPQVKLNRVFDRALISEEGSVGQTTISAVMEGSGSKFISFQGQIISRSHSDPEPVKGKMQRHIQQCSLFTNWSKFQISTPENRCVRLQVRDLDSSAEITVFLNLENTVYLLGLLPGAVVLFTKLERKVSRMGNIYCRYVAVSSVHLIALPSTELRGSKRGCETDDHAGRGAEKILQKQRLINLWHSRTAASEFQSVCDLLQILKISLKCVCGLCGGSIVRSECPSSGCHMDNGSKFTARVSFIVDDGTSVAIVTQTGTEVRRLLGLSHDQWVCLEAEVRDHGEVFVQQTRPVCGSVLEKFVYMLCDNKRVKKSWMMSLKTKYSMAASNSTMDLDTLSLDDFALKSIDTGIATVSTRCLPFLQLECTGLQEVDPTMWTLHYLN